MKISLLTFINFALFIAFILSGILLIQQRSRFQKISNDISILDREIKENEDQYIKEKKIFLDSRHHLHILECAEQHQLTTPVIRESIHEKK